MCMHDTVLQWSTHGARWSVCSQLKMFKLDCCSSKPCTTGCTPRSLYSPSFWEWAAINAAFGKEKWKVQACGWQFTQGFDYTCFNSDLFQVEYRNISGNKGWRQVYTLSGNMSALGCWGAQTLLHAFSHICEPWNSHCVVVWLLQKGFTHLAQVIC